MQRYSAQEQYLKATQTTHTKSMPDIVILQKLGVSSSKGMGGLRRCGLRVAWVYSSFFRSRSSKMVDPWVFLRFDVCLPFFFNLHISKLMAVKCKCTGPEKCGGKGTPFFWAVKWGLKEVKSGKVSYTPHMLQKYLSLCFITVYFTYVRM